MRDRLNAAGRLDPLALDENLGSGIGHDHARRGGHEAAGSGAQFRSGIGLSGSGRNGARRRAERGPERRQKAGNGRRDGRRRHVHRRRRRGTKRGNTANRGLDREKGRGLGRGRRTGKRRRGRTGRDRLACRRSGRRRGFCRNTRHRLGYGGRPCGRNTADRRGLELARGVHRQRRGCRDVGTRRRSDFPRGRFQRSRRKTDTKCLALWRVWILTLGRRIGHNYAFLYKFLKMFNGEIRNGNRFMWLSRLLSRRNVLSGIGCLPETFKSG